MMAVLARPEADSGTNHRSGGASNEEQAGLVITAWDASQARDRTLFNVWLDFVFRVVYSTTVALGYILVSGVFLKLPR